MQYIEEDVLVLKRRGKEPCLQGFYEQIEKLSTIFVLVSFLLFQTLCLFRFTKTW